MEYAKDISLGWGIKGPVHISIRKLAAQTGVIMKPWPWGKSYEFVQRIPIRVNGEKDNVENFAKGLEKELQIWGAENVP